jgi:hypothetical protein
MDKYTENIIKTIKECLEEEKKAKKIPLKKSMKKIIIEKYLDKIKENKNV